MKTSRYFLLFAAFASPAALLITGCSKTDTPSTVADKAGDDVKALATDVKDTAVDTWDSIKGYTYERRDAFTASIDRQTAKMDDKTAELKTKASGAQDAAIKDYDSARADLKTQLAALGNATADTWADAKEKVSQAWKQVQAAYDKVTSTSAS